MLLITLILSGKLGGCVWALDGGYDQRSLERSLHISTLLPNLVSVVDFVPSALAGEELAI